MEKLEELRQEYDDLDWKYAELKEMCEKLKNCFNCKHGKNPTTYTYAWCKLIDNRQDYSKCEKWEIR